MSYFNAYLKRYLGPFALAVTALGAEAFCDLLQPTIMAAIVDEGISRNDLGLVLSKGLLMLAVAGAGACAAVTRNWIASNVSQKLGAEIRSDLLRRIVYLPKEDRDALDPGSLITRMTNDATQVQNFANGIMRIFMKAPLLCIGGITMATILDVRLAIILYGVVVVVGTLISINLRLGFPLFAKIQARLDGMNSAVREYLAGIRVVKAYNNQVFERDKFNAANDGLTDASISSMRVMAAFTPLIHLSVNLGIVLVLWMGGVYRIQGLIGMGKIIAFVNYMTQILMSLGVIAHAFNTFVRAKASADRISGVMNLGATVGARDGCVPAGSGKGAGISFHDVTFTYKGSKEPALYGVSFECGPGETLGIIGSTGSGKSTLVSLLLGFYRPDSGEIRVNGHCIDGMDAGALRGMMAVVPQKSLLFTGRIDENIRWGKPSASMDEVREAAGLAQADAFINGFPDGYGTILGQGGVNLSGGQKQRVAIARALVGKPSLLVLDDCTSAVDTSTEAMITEGLRIAARGMTTVAITQRISTVMGMDRILVLDEGRVAGFGTHGELMGTCRVYVDIHRSQLGGGSDAGQAIEGESA